VNVCVFCWHNPAFGCQKLVNVVVCCLCLLQLLKRPVSGVRRMAAHPILPYCKHSCFFYLSAKPVAHGRQLWLLTSTADNSVGCCSTQANISSGCSRAWNASALNLYLYRVHRASWNVRERLGIVLVKFPGLDSAGNLSVRSWKVLEFARQCVTVTNIYSSIDAAIILYIYIWLVTAVCLNI